MTPYIYQRATSIADALSGLGTKGASLLAGGTDLIAQMKSGQRTPAHIVDVKAVPELTSISRHKGGGLRIGAALSATAIAQHDAVAAGCGALHDSVQLIGSLQIQNRATLGGNVCNAAPSADAVPALIVAGGEGVIAGPSGERSIAIEKLFDGPGRTTLGSDEMLVGIDLPAPEPGSASAYLRFTPRREMDIAIVGAAVQISVDKDQTITHARVSLASVAPTPVRAPSAERVLIGQRISATLFAAAGDTAQGDATPISDTRASADYRTHLIAVLVRRTLAVCVTRLGLELPA